MGKRKQTIFKKCWFDITNQELPGQLAKKQAFEDGIILLAPGAGAQQSWGWRKVGELFHPLSVL